MQIKGNIKYIIIAVVIAVLVFAIGAFTITTLNHTLDNKQVEYSDVVIADKYINNDTQHYYIIVSESGTVYDMLNFTDSDDVYDHLKVGNKYKFVTQKPLSVDDKYIHIIQVFNETS